MGTRRANVAGWLLVALIVAAVELVVRLFDLHDSIAAPSAAFAALGDGLWSGQLSGDLAQTLATYTAGLALAIVVGVALGIALGSSRTLHDATSVVVEVLRPIPAIAIIPLAILVFGLGPPMLRFVIAYAAVWPILINTVYGVRGADRLHHDVARTSGVTGLRRLVRVTLPGAAPSIATGVRISASVALLVGVTAEFLAASDGIGAYMQRQQSAFQLPELYAAVVLVGLLGYAVNVVLRLLQARVVFWVGDERSGSR
jgi:NitT/TauT family transport system permease protein